MPKLRRVSGSETIKALERLGFEQVRTRGSHVVMKKLTAQGQVGCVVPLHRELAVGLCKEFSSRRRYQPMNSWITCNRSCHLPGWIETATKELFNKDIQDAQVKFLILNILCILVNLFLIPAVNDTIIAPPPPSPAGAVFPGG